LSTVALVATYFFGALAVGTVIFLWGHWARSRLRAAVLGFATAAGLMGLFSRTVSPHKPTGVGLAFAMVVFGLFPGSILGAMFWSPPRRP